MILDEQRELAMNRVTEYLESGDKELATKALNEFLNVSMTLLELDNLAEATDRL